MNVKIRGLGVFALCYELVKIDPNPGRPSNSPAPFDAGRSTPGQNIVQVLAIHAGIPRNAGDRQGVVFREPATERKYEWVH